MSDTKKLQDVEEDNKKLRAALRQAETCFNMIAANSVGYNGAPLSHAAANEAWTIREILGDN